MKLALSFILVLLSLNVFAANQDSKGLILDYIKLGCKDPGAVHNQLPPSELKVTCKWSQWDWVPGPTTYGEMPNCRKVSGSLMTNKPNLHVPRETWGLPAGSTQTACPSYVEEYSEGETVYNVTCDEVIAMTSIKDFCAAKMAADIEANESILTTTKTGKTMSMCAAAAGTVSQK